MSEMVDRVVSAMVEAQNGTGSRFADYEAMARAAIAVMREPTEAMVDAGALRAFTFIVDDDRFIEAAYKEMIDAALKD